MVEVSCFDSEVIKELVVPLHTQFIFMRVFLLLCSVLNFSEQKLCKSPVTEQYVYPRLYESP